MEISRRDEKICELEQQVVTLRRDVRLLEERIEDSEAYNRRDEMIVSRDAVTAGMNLKTFRNLCVILSRTS